jgi:hypothetical protein
MVATATVKRVIITGSLFKVVRQWRHDRKR